MNNSRSAIRHILAVTLMAGALAACGIKGELEPPPRVAAGEKPAPSDDAKSQQAAEPKLFTERSVVRSVRPPTMAPDMPPPEWKKSRVYQSAPSPAAPRKKRDDDEPFFLDRIL